MASSCTDVDIDPRRLQNLRDLGGTALPGGAVLASGVLYRSDAPRAGDAGEDGMEWPPRTVVDLRSAEELGAVHPLAPGGADVVALPLSSQAGIENLLEAPRGALDNLAALYVGMLLERAPEIVRATALLAEAPAPVLVHCAAGKDRTGTLIAVVLLAVGVDEEAVVADYLQTGERMEGVLARLVADPEFVDGEAQVRRLLAERPELLGVSEPAIRAVLAHLEAAGGAARWLVEHGLSERQLELLRARLAVDA